MESIDEDVIQLVRKYHYGGLSESEKSLLESRRSLDPSFAQAFETSKLLLAGMESFYDSKLKATLAKSDSKVNTWRWTWPAAAAAAIVFVVAYYLLPSSDRLFDKYFNTYPNVGHSQYRNNETTTTNTDRPFNLYEHEFYQEAILSFDSLLDQNPNDNEAAFYRGVSYLALGEGEKAFVSLNLIDSNSEFYEPAAWYRALACIKTGETEKSRSILLEIVSSKSAYQDKASRLLSELD